LYPAYFLMRRLGNKILFIVGWLLSPLTWWNDAVLNIPLAYFLANLVAYFMPKLFMSSLIIFYWLTNLAGVALMHLSSRDSLKGKKKGLKIILTLFFYSLAIYILAKKRFIRPIF